MSSHLFSPAGGVSGIDYNTKHTFQRVCVCVYVFARVRHGGSNIARLVAHLSPVLICLFLLDFQRNHTRERKKKLNQLNFPESSHYSTVKSHRTKHKIQKGREREREKKRLHPIIIIIFFKN